MHSLAYTYKEIKIYADQGCAQVEPWYQAYFIAAYALLMYVEGVFNEIVIVVL